MTAPTQETLAQYVNRTRAGDLVQREYQALISQDETHWATRRSLLRRIHELEAIIARDDTTESYRCSECGAWHLRPPQAAPNE
jgi:hypothetical protein